MASLAIIDGTDARDKMCYNVFCHGSTLSAGVYNDLILGSAV